MPQLGQDPDEPLNRDAIEATHGPREAGIDAIVADAQITPLLFDFKDALEADDRVIGDRDLTPDEANREFGVDGYLTFDRPISRAMAAFQQKDALRRRYRDQAIAAAPEGSISDLDALGSSLYGAATDPAAVPFYFMGGEGALAARITQGLRAGKVANAGTRWGGIGLRALEGSVDGLGGSALFEGGITLPLRQAAGDDYDAGDASTNLVVGSALGAGLGGVGGAFEGKPRTRERRRPGGGHPEADRIRALGGDDTDVTIASIETGGSFNRRSQNPNSSAGGLFQFTDETWNALGGGDKYDLDLNIKRGLELRRQNEAALRRALKRDPQGWEIYLAHQQGARGASELLENPGRSAVEALRAAGVRDPEAHIRLNGGRVDMTAGEFAAIWRKKFAEHGGEAGTASAGPAETLPPEIRAMSEGERTGAFAEAVEAMVEDRRFDLGEAGLAPGPRPDRMAALDEAANPPRPINAVPVREADDVAVSPRGRDIPVRYAVVELDDLTLSHGDNYQANPDYPQALQPRDRSRAGSQANGFEMESRFNPKLLMFDSTAAGGAPIISAAGVVESGNGRGIVLRRSANTDGRAYGLYLDELKAQGVNTAGFRRPVLVRVRQGALSGPERVQLASELNGDVVEAMGPVEQAMVDARRMDTGLLDLLDNQDTAKGRRDFERAFIARVTPERQNVMVGKDGRTTFDAGRRIDAALVARAYGDASLTAALFEDADPNIKIIGKALIEAAPAWASMRAAAAEGLIPADVDMTPHLKSAISLVRHARDNRLNLGELVADRLDQTEMFGGSAVSVETEAFLRIVFRDADFKRQRSAERVAFALSDIATRAREVVPGPNLFGELPESDAGRILQSALEKVRNADDPAEAASLALFDPDRWTSRQAEPAGLDLRPARGDDGRQGGSDGGPGNRSGPEGAGGQDAGLSPRQRLEALPQPPAALKAEALGDILNLQLLADEGDLAGLHAAVDAYRRHAGKTGSDLGPRSGPLAGKLADYGDTLLNRPKAAAERPEAAALPAKGFYEADPELRAIQADTDALALQHGLEPAPVAPDADPANLAEAIRAAAFCIAHGAE